jgi:hypothetical protein
MPLGNGDLAANAWTEQNGDLVLLLAKSDAYTEAGKLVKLGRVRIHMTPSVLAAGRSFTQALRLDRSAIEIAEGGSHVRVWIDANHAAVHIEAQTAEPTKMTAMLEMWRATHPLAGGGADSASMNELGSDKYPVEFRADSIVPKSTSEVAWYHFNEQSIYSTVLEQQHLSTLKEKYPDPLLHRCFGAEMTGDGMDAASETELRSAKASTTHRVDVVALSQWPTISAEEFVRTLEETERTANPKELGPVWAAHVAWWHGFWNRSWVDVTGDAQAQAVSQGYVLQRYMIAAESRGTLPVKFNGGLFTVGHDMVAGAKSSATDHNPDYRAWGNAYWNQNNRLLYWPLLASGDYDLMLPWFAMYTQALPLAKDRTKVYYRHDGASLPETMFFWGLPSMHDFGWNNPKNEIDSRWQRYHIQGSLEVVAQMLDYYEATGDSRFAHESLVPFADAIVTYYGEHWQRAPDGKILMHPTQSLETYQLDITDPTPDIAGLMSVIPRLLALPTALTTPKQVAAWQKTLHDLPPIAVGRSTAAGKTPPLGAGDAKGVPVILPAVTYGKTSNSENPELYVAFPYHVYGVDKPELKLATDTFAARRSPQDTCWGQDGTEAAALGLTDVAQTAVIAEFTNYGDERFRWFWKPAHDWIPDLDNGGSGMITLQSMLLQTDGKKIILLPAWPKKWTAEFRLHSAENTVVEGRVEEGKLTRVRVWPKERQSDLVVMSAAK